MIFTHVYEKFYFSYFVYVNMIIVCIAQWLSEANFEILHCSGAFARRHKHCKPECSFMKPVSIIFYRENMT